MSFFSDFFQSGPFLALLVSTLIFLLTIFLVAKGWINLSVTTLLLLFAVTIGLVINYQQGTQYSFDHPFDDSSSNSQELIQLKQDIQNEKENLQQVSTQMQDLIKQMNNQKKQLQVLIEDTKQQLKAVPIEPTKPIESIEHPPSIESIPSI